MTTFMYMYEGLPMPISWRDRCEKITDLDVELDDGEGGVVGGDL